MKMKKILLLLLFISTIAMSQTISGKVVSISDGDTFTLLDQFNVQHKIRLAEIDAPENSQPFGKAAKKKLSDLIFGKFVKVFYKERDIYKRIIGKVYTGQMYVSEEMIAAGLAWHYKTYSNSEKLSLLEEIAKKDKIGLWVEPGAIAPWEWRKN